MKQLSKESFLKSLLPYLILRGVGR